MKKQALEVLASNLTKLHAASEMSARGWAVANKLDPKMEYRARNQDIKIGDTLQVIADKLKLEPWQLLHPDFHPGKVPAPSVLSPLAVDLGKTLDRITDPDRRQSVYATLLQMLKELQTAAGHAATPEPQAPSLPPTEEPTHTP